MCISKASYSELNEILILQKVCFYEEAMIYNDFSIAPLHETLENLQQQYNQDVCFFKLKIVNQIVGSVRAYQENNTCYIGKLIVHPDFQNKGYGTMLLQAIEQQFPLCERYELYTGNKSEKNLYLYKKMGYKEFKCNKISENICLVFLEKSKHK